MVRIQSCCLGGLSRGGNRGAQRRGPPAVFKERRRVANRF